MSYRRQETEWPAGWLFDRLTEHFHGAQVFKDIDSIEPGDDFVEVITSAVQSCDVLLALIGDRWLTMTDAEGRRRIDNPDDYVRIEIQAALDRNVRVVPILIYGARMPQAQDMPPSLAGLVRRQALELSVSRFDDDVSRLLRVLDKTLAGARARPAPLQEQAETPPETQTPSEADTPPQTQPRIQAPPEAQSPVETRTPSGTQISPEVDTPAETPETPQTPPQVCEQPSAAFGLPIALDTHPKHDIAFRAAIPTTAPAGTYPDDTITAGDTAEAMPALIPAPVDPAATDNRPTPAGAAAVDSVTTAEAAEATNEHRSGIPTGIPRAGGTPAATPGTPTPTSAATAGEGREDAASQSNASRGRLRVPLRLGLVITLAAALLGSVVGTALGRLGPSHDVNLQQSAAEIPVPAVARSGAAALKTLRAAGFDVRTATVRDPRVPKGQVLRTDPPTGAKVLRHSIVTLVVSDGPGIVAVPKISGTEADARRALATAGLQVKVLTEGSETVPKGQVTRIEPKAGSSVQAGSAVTVYISTGTSGSTGPSQAVKVKVPSVQGLGEGDARKALQQQAFQVRLGRHYNPDVAAGQAIGTVPPAGTLADKGSTVVLDVSLGPRETTLSPACSISPAVGGPGDAVEVTCQGFTANDTVSVAWNGTTIGSGTADDRGNVTIPATIPSGSLGAGYPGRTWDLDVSGHAGGSTSVVFKNAPEPSPTPTPSGG